ncbi:type I polyketide synthase [Nocardia brasiliensis]|uniref:type I polyketide synthase n=1 Tax=Nocardia brasiliensis TaxID=37326 RepID=UPI0024566BC2|nr:type I polyketide synthase [Nocardia brasiliensis]
MSASNDCPIAIIGMGCRLPGGVCSPAGLWDLILSGRDTATPIPVDRWDAAGIALYQAPELVDPSSRACFIEGNVRAWEPEAFSVAPTEAAAVDPQVRILLEVAWEAVAHAGIPHDRIRGTRTGVYVGAYTTDNLIRNTRSPENTLGLTYLAGNLIATLAGRVAFGLDLRGPALAVGTHCSSGMVAMDLACSQLTLGDCDLALAGASMLMLVPQTHLAESRLLLSPTGRSSPFDSAADGYVRGEGAGVLLLKRLVDARRDGDNVLAVIRGSAVNNDGQSGRFTAPSARSQEALFRSVVDLAGIDPAHVGLLEAHGPGTVVGDPIEFRSLDAVYGHGTGRCALGSVKSNIGHTEPVSGIAGTIKAVQALRHGLIPPNRNFRKWNPQIERVAGSRLFVPTELTPWPGPAGPRLAAVSSYGIVGTNGHIILEQAPVARTVTRSSVPERAGEPPAARVYPLSSLSRTVVRANAIGLADWLETDPAIRTTDDTAPAVSAQDLAHTLAMRRWHGPCRAGLIATGLDELVRAARGLGANVDDSQVVTGDVVLPDDHPGPVFVYTGHGSQWAGMCQDLLGGSAEFTGVIDELEPLIQAESGFSVRRMITHPAQMSGMARVQPTLFAIQLALTEMWRSWGIHPSGVIGHSMGEVAAAVVAGALSRSDATAVICRRSTLLATLPGGAMASVRLAADQVAADLTAAHADRVSVAVVASAASTVISGDAAQINEMVQRWTAQGHLAALVGVEVASHCAHVDPLLAELRVALADLSPRPPRIRFFSTVDPEPRVLDADYWADNLRRPVQFASACRSAFEAGHRLMIECSPHPIGVLPIADTAAQLGVGDAVTLGTLSRDSAGEHSFLTSLLTAYCAGAQVDWGRRYGTGELVELPPTAWNRTNWDTDEPPHELVYPTLVGATQHALLGGRVQDPDAPNRTLWQTPLGPVRVPWLAEHQVTDVPVMPGAGIAEMMLAAAVSVFGTSRVTLSRLTLSAPLVLDPEPVVTTTLVRETDDSGRVVVRSTSDQETVVHAAGLVERLTGAPDPLAYGPVAEGAYWEDCRPEEVYRCFRERHRVVHGKSFQGLDHVLLHQDGYRAIATVHIPEPARMAAGKFALHPVLLDSVVHAIAAVWLFRHATEAGPVLVSGIGAIRVHAPTGHTRQARIEVTRVSVAECVASVVLVDRDATVTAEIDDLRIVNVTTPAERFERRLLQQIWVPAPLPEPEAGDRAGTNGSGVLTPGRWLLVATHDEPWGTGIVAALAEYPGVDVHLVTGSGDLDTFRSDLVAALRNPGSDTWAAVVLLIDGHQTGEGDDPPAAARSRVARLATMLPLVAGLPQPPRVWVMTSGPDTETLATGGLCGMLRTATYEYPYLNPGLMHADDSTDPAVLARDLLTATGVPIEIAWRDGVRYVARLRTGLPLEAPADLAEDPAVVRRHGTYLVTGGLGALGMAAARWLCAQGAGHVVLCGRTGPTREVERRLADLRAEGTSITVVLGDIAEPAIAHRAITAAPQLRGIIHTAGVVEDATLSRLTPELIARVWRGKVEGAWALHLAARRHNLDLDFWVNYSSAAALLGSPGQAAYAAANTWLDAFTAWRRRQGLAANSIQWGAWSEIGRGQHMGERGLSLISPADGIDALHRLIRLDLAHIGYTPVDLDQWLRPYPDAARSALFSELRSSNSEGDDSEVLEAVLAATTLQQRRHLIEQHIIACVREIMHITDRPLNPTTSLLLTGLDSIAAVQLENMLNRTLRIVIGAEVMWIRPNAAAIATSVLDRMGFAADSSAPADSPQPAGAVAEAGT